MTYLRKIDHATSVKEINIVKETSKTEYGIADFKYRPVFSVFDIGTIVPPIPLDNTTVNIMQAFNFELLQKAGIESHYLGLVNTDGSLISVKDAISKKIYSDICRVKFVNRIIPDFHDKKWDYSKFKKIQINNYVLPLEFISRNSLPENSSVWKRVKDGELKLEDLGLDKNYQIGQNIPSSILPILDYSTKFEPDDRYISNLEALNILGIDEKAFFELNETTKKVSKTMTDYANSRGFTREDGKIEYITINEYNLQKIILGDAVCTWHEDRLLTPSGLGISKQRIRDKIKKINPHWYEEIRIAKLKAKNQGFDDFRNLMNKEIKYTSPEPEFFEKINLLFQAGTNMWINKKFYNIYENKNESLNDNLNRAVEDFYKVI